MSVAILLAFLSLSLALSMLWRARDLYRSGRDGALLIEAEAAGQTIPDTAFPRIDPELCIGSGTCVTACPERGVLGIVDGVAKLITPGACVGHGECAAACPVAAIRLVFGTPEHPVSLPVYDDELQTNLPGVYIAGEASGISLIRNAVRLGRRAADAIVSTGRRAAGEDMDALVIGAGPAGLSAALALKEQGLSVEVLERSATPLATLHAYPIGKRVQTGTLELAGQKRIRGAALSKEDLLARLNEVTARGELTIRANEAVLALEPRGVSGWTVKTARGARSAANVVVALGRRGTPRTLDVPGAQLPKVRYQLTAPGDANGRHALVVGGGNSAVESVFALLDHAQPASISLSYRKPRLTRLRAENRTRFEAEVAAGRVRVLIPTDIAAVEARSVRLRDESGRELRIDNDLVIAQLGALSPIEELHRFGIRVVDKRGEA